MFGWLRPKSPLTDEERRWIDTKFAWLTTEFGARSTAPVITPTEAFFPDDYDEKPEDVAKIFQRLCGYMGIDDKRVELSFYTSDSADDYVNAFNPVISREYALGMYWEENGRAQIMLESSRLSEPMEVVATLAHELGHVLLLGEGRYSRDEPDHEPLTDLLTVYFGLGIFKANSVIREVNWSSGQWAGWSLSKQGYLSGPQCAYALARFAVARGETKPLWKRFLRRDIKAWMDAEIRELQTRAKSPTTSQKSTAASDEIAAEFKRNTSAPSSESPEATRGESELEHEENQDSHEHSVEASTADEWFSHGVAYFKEKQFEQAIAAYEKALHFEPDDSEIRLHLAEALLVVGAFQQGIDHCDRILAADTHDPLVYRCRGRANVFLGSYAAAVEDLDQARKRDRRDVVTWMFLGLAHLGQMDFREARAAFDKALRLNHKWADIYLARSRANEGLGKQKEAEADLAEAIRRAPELADESKRAARLAGIR